MVEGTTLKTCKAAGMDAVCPGTSSCKYNNPTCLQPIGSTKEGCTFPDSLFEDLCINEPACPEVAGLFVSMAGWEGGDLGVVGNDRMARGKKFVSGEEDVLFALCVLADE